MKNDHVNAEQLVAYACGELDGEEAARVEAVMAASLAATALVVRLRDVVETMREMDVAAPPRATVRRVLAAFARCGTRSGAGWLARVQWFVAELVFDSRAQPALAGYRGSLATRQMAYDSPYGRIDLQILPRDRGAAGERCRVRGQVTLHEDAAFGAVTLCDDTGGAGVAAETIPDRHGRFTMDVAAGAYDLLVELDQGDRVILACNVEIAEELGLGNATDGRLPH
jgi:anti-sigma factor RsiW